MKDEKNINFGSLADVTGGKKNKEMEAMKKRLDEQEKQIKELKEKVDKTGTI